MVCVATGLAGCSSGGARIALLETVPRGQFSELVATGDWDDVEAAVIIGAEQAEMALISTEAGEPGRLAFDLVTVGGEPVVLTALRGDGSAIVLQSRAGRFGDHDKERRLMSAVAARLRALHGREFAPVRR